MLPKTVTQLRNKEIASGSTSDVFLITKTRNGHKKHILRKEYSGISLEELKTYHQLQSLAALSVNNGEDTYIEYGVGTYMDGRRVNTTRLKILPLDPEKLRIEKSIIHDKEVIVMEPDYIGGKDPWGLFDYDPYVNNFANTKINTLNTVVENHIKGAVSQYTSEGELRWMSAQNMKGIMYNNELIVCVTDICRQLSALKNHLKAGAIEESYQKGYNKEAIDKITTDIVSIFNQSNKR